MVHDAWPIIHQGFWLLFALMGAIQTISFLYKHLLPFGNTVVGFFIAIVVGCLVQALPLYRWSASAVTFIKNLVVANVEKTMNAMQATINERDDTILLLKVRLAESRSETKSSNQWGDDMMEQRDVLRAKYQQSLRDAGEQMKISKNLESELYAAAEDRTTLLNNIASIQQEGNRLQYIIQQKDQENAKLMAQITNNNIEREKIQQASEQDHAVAREAMKEMYRDEVTTLIQQAKEDTSKSYTEHIISLQTQSTNLQAQNTSLKVEITKYEAERQVKQMQLKEQEEKHIVQINHIRQEALETINALHTQLAAAVAATATAETPAEMAVVTTAEAEAEMEAEMEADLDAELEAEEEAKALALALVKAETAVEVPTNTFTFGDAGVTGQENPFAGVSNPFAGPVRVEEEATDMTFDSALFGLMTPQQQRDYRRLRPRRARKHPKGNYPIDAQPPGPSGSN